MFKRTFAFGLLICASAVTAEAQDAKTVISTVSKALGADVKTVQYSATGFEFALGQNPNANAPWPKFIEKSYTRAIDFDAKVRKQFPNTYFHGSYQPLSEIDLTKPNDLFTEVCDSGGCFV